MKWDAFRIELSPPIVHHDIYKDFILKVSVRNQLGGLGVFGASSIKGQCYKNTSTRTYKRLLELINVRIYIYRSPDASSNGRYKC